MDLGFYLGELLMHRGVVRMPGLGIFSQVRMSAYYDESESIFHPPYTKVNFEPKADVDDDQLAAYLVERKGISLASAKYFIEKYINNLRQQAIVADVPLGNMGAFCTEMGELSFRPNDRLDDNSDLYGYAPVKIERLKTVNPEREPVWEDQPEPEAEPGISPEPEPEYQTNHEREAESAPEPEPFAMPKIVYPLYRRHEPEIAEEPVEYTPDPVMEHNDNFAPTYDEAFLDLPEEEEEERRGPLRAILITLAILGILGIGAFAIYRYAPETFTQLQFWKNSTPAQPVKPRSNTIEIPGLDTLHTDSVKSTLNDSTVKVADSVKVRRFELITDKGYETFPQAREAVRKLRAAGLNKAKLVEELPGTLIRVSVGTFSNLSESEAARQKLIKEGKLTEGSRTQEIVNE